MPHKLIVGNWKMYPTLSDSMVLSSTLRKSLEEIRGVEVVIAPPTAFLVPILESWRHRLPHLHLAAQNVWPNDQGAYTGEVSAYLLKSIISYAIIGHSERRQYAGEDNDLIHQKIQACLQWGIRPILCVGEAKKMIDGNGSFDSYQLGKLTEQLLEGVSAAKKDSLAKVVVAYEPVWAIGTGNAATPEYTLKVIDKLREKLIDKYGEAEAELVQFIYGGSVSAENAGEFLKYPQIGGFLAGGVSVKAGEFLKICRLAAQTK